MTIEWIPITYRPMDEEEKKEYAERTGYDEEDLDTMYDCPLPDDGEEVLVSTKWGTVATTTFYDDEYGCYFEQFEDEGDALAWMPLPKPYEEDKDGGKKNGE